MNTLSIYYYKNRDIEMKNKKEALLQTA